MDDSAPPCSTNSPDRPGTLLVISGPSGVGKSTIVSTLIARRPFHFSVSVTTRAPRTGEVDGVHYRFVDAAAFRQFVRSGAMLEWAEYSGAYYGTPRAEVVDVLRSGSDVLLDIENQGALQVKRAYPEALTVFLAPPDLEELERRLRSRRDTDDADIRRRLEIAGEQLDDARRHYDAVVVNDDVSRAVDEILRILATHQEGSNAQQRLH